MIDVHVIQLEVAMETYMYEAVASPPKRYALKRPRLRIVRRAVQSAFRAAAAEAERIYASRGWIRLVAAQSPLDEVDASEQFAGADGAGVSARRPRSRRAVGTDADAGRAP